MTATDRPDATPRTSRRRTTPATRTRTTTDRAAAPPPGARGGGSRSGSGGGGPTRSPRLGRRPTRRQRRRSDPGSATVIAVLVIAFVVLMLAFGIELWTDAIWFKSVGYDQVFWTRRRRPGRALRSSGWSSPSRSSSATCGSPAGSCPRRRRRGRHAQGLDRSSQRSRGERRPVAPARAVGPVGRRGGQGRGPVAVTPVDMPDLIPLGRIAIVVVIVLTAFGVAGSIAGTWQTILLWQHGVPFDPSGTVVPGPDLRPRHLVLPVRPAVPPVPPGGGERPAGRRAAGRRGALPALRRRRVAGLQHPRPGPPRRPRGPVPDGRRPRLPARQARPRPQHARDRDRRLLHRPARPVHRLRPADGRLGDHRGTAPRRRLRPRPLARRHHGRVLVHRVHRDRPRLPRDRPADHGGPEPADPRGALHLEQHRDDPARVQPRHVGGAAVCRATSR